MKHFVIRLVLEFIVIATTTIVATQLVKNGYSAFGLGALVIYAGIMLMRLWFSRVDLSFSQDINKVLEERLDNTKAQMRRLELALVEASVETLWVSKVTEDGVYIVETPDHGCFVIIGEEETDDAKTEDAPAAPEEG